MRNFTYNFDGSTNIQIFGENGIYVFDGSGGSGKTYLYKELELRVNSNSSNSLKNRVTLYTYKVNEGLIKRGNGTDVILLDRADLYKSSVMDILKQYNINSSIILIDLKCKYVLNQNNVDYNIVFPVIEHGCIKVACVGW